MQARTKKRAVISLCPIRFFLGLAGAAVIAAYFLFRRNGMFTGWVCSHVTRPWHRFASAVCNIFPFSVCGLLIALAAAAIIFYTVFALFRIIKGPQRLAAAFRLIITLLSFALLVYAGFCLLWGTYYYSSDFEEQSGIEAAPVSAGELKTVTAYFTKLANEYGALVSRDENGVFNEELGPVFERSSTLYENVQEKFPCLEYSPRRAKPFMFSKIMSYINFTGFFFPFTGEANINTDSPACLVPSTIAHELAHQRGVAKEQEANFAAVLASLESGDAVYSYSASLLAYIHLSNALYDSDYDAWADNYAMLSEEVKADLMDNNRYWAQYETPVSNVSDTVYTGFLQSYGQTLGLKSYGACIDLLVAYYYDIARSELNADS